jgi:hypothetical protein
VAVTFLCFLTTRNTTILKLIYLLEVKRRYLHGILKIDTPENVPPNGHSIVRIEKSYHSRLRIFYKGSGKRSRHWQVCNGSLIESIKPKKEMQYNNLKGIFSLGMHFPEESLVFYKINYF